MGNGPRLIGWGGGGWGVYPVSHLELCALEHKVAVGVILVIFCDKALVVTEDKGLVVTEDKDLYVEY